MSRDEIKLNKRYPIARHCLSWLIADESGWRVRVVVAHKGQERDGVEFAREVIAEWARVLSSFGLTD